MTNKVGEPKPSWASKKFLRAPRWAWIISFIAIAPSTLWTAHLVLVAWPAHHEELLVWNTESTEAVLRNANIPPSPPGPPMWPGAAAVIWMIVALAGGFGWVAIRKRPKGGPLIWWVPPVARCGVFAALGFFLVGLVGSWAVPLSGYKLFWGLGIPLLAVACGVLSTREYRKIRAMRSPSCWSCDYDIGRLHPDSTCCPECAYPISDSINRWKKMQGWMQPQWLARYLQSVSPDSAPPLAMELSEADSTTDMDPQALPPAIARLGRLNVVLTVAGPILSLAVGGMMIWIWPDTMFTWYWWSAVVAIMLAPILGQVRDARLCRSLRGASHLQCWSCLGLLPRDHPDSAQCECGFPVSESISRWKVCPKAFRPRWVAEGEGREKSATAQDASEARG